LACKSQLLIHLVVFGVYRRAPFAIVTLVAVLLNASLGCRMVGIIGKLMRIVENAALIFDFTIEGCFVLRGVLRSKLSVSDRLELCINLLDHISDLRLHLRLFLGLQ
jgi:hypothetical protein